MNTYMYFYEHMLLIQDLNEVQLIVVIERERVDYFELVDKVCIPIAMNDFSESEEHYGMYGIVSITLGYKFIITSQDNSGAVHQGQ